MKALICGAAALILLSSALQAQDKATLDPNKMTGAAQRPTLQLDDRQRAAIRQGLVTENTEQKTPPNYEAKVGEAIPLTMTVDAMPAPLIAREPSLKQYGYAKLARQLLVIDPLKKTVIAVLPRTSPTTGKAATSLEWAGTRGRELTGQAPEPPVAGAAPALEPAGDSGDKKNGNEAATKER
jgi:hypothetical protein